MMWINLCHMRGVMLFLVSHAAVEMAPGWIDMGGRSTAHGPCLITIP